MGTKVTTESHTKVEMTTGSEEKQAMEQMSPKGMGMLDMVIAFDTTGSMAAYIADVRRQVAEMIPRLFADNEDLRLGIVAFGDYCDMEDPQTFGKAYQCLPLTRSENDIIRFVMESKDTNGGDGDEFYELVLRKIIDESPWREGSSRAILLIADAHPHPVGYRYKDHDTGEVYVDYNRIDWKYEAKRAAERKIKIDTVSIKGAKWYKELSEMTNGISVPFRSSENTGVLIETAATARSTMAFRDSARRSEDASTREYCTARAHGLMSRLSNMFMACDDEEMSDIGECYSRAIEEEPEG